MNILLDTHIYLWWLNWQKPLAQKARQIIEDAEIVYVSAISIWEIGIKIQSRKFDVDINKLINEISANDFHELPVIANHTKALMTLKRHHGDPFDRMLVAQAISEPLHFLTADHSLTPYAPELIIAV